VDRNLKVAIDEAREAAKVQQWPSGAVRIANPADVGQLLRNDGEAAPGLPRTPCALANDAARPASDPPDRSRR
jgi:hypothetical protein